MYIILIIYHLVQPMQRKELMVVFFSKLIISELQLRRLPVYSGFEDRRERLKRLLNVEQQLDIIMQAISRGDEGKEAALMLISQAIPCRK